MKKDVWKCLYMYVDWMVFNGDLFLEFFYLVIKLDDIFVNFIYFFLEICY